MAYKVSPACLKFSLVVCFLLLLQPVFCQYNFGEVDGLLTRDQKLLGGAISALVYKDGKIIYKKDIGQDFNAKTQAPIGGASQWISDVVIMSLVDEGKLSLDDPVMKYIPIFADYSKKYITIRNCLTHTTGIQAEAPGLKNVLTRKKYATLEEEVTAFAKREIERNPGEEFFYSNIGPNIAARIAEVVTKKTFDRLVSDRVLRPLKMHTTSFSLDYNKAIDAADGGFSSANDYMNFLIMILNKGMFDNKQVLSEKSIDEMQKMQTGTAAPRYTPKGYEGLDYGLGEWVLEKDASGKASVVSGPAVYGTWPYVDYCRGYACIILTKTVLSEEKKDVYQALKAAIDQQIPATCK